MTVTGLVVIPLSLVIIFLPWRYIIPALLVFAMLSSAAVVNVGSFGLQPGYFFGMLIIARTAVEIVVLSTPLNAHVIRMVTPLLLFAIICFVSIWVGLTFFQGKIMVISSTAGFNLDLAQSYTFQRQNLTQPFYLLLNTGILYVLAHQVARLPPDQVSATLDQAVLGAILFAGLVVIWEIAHFYFGVPFSSGFFHSNAGYYAADSQAILGEVLRVSGPFSEPSALAYYFAAFLMYAWCRYMSAPSIGAMGVVLFCIAAMAASTSTTALAVLGIFALLVVKDVVVLAASRTKINLSLHHLGVAALLGVAGLGAFVFVQSNWYEIDGVLTKILFEKNQSGSFAQRSGADMMAIDIVMQTGGIGIGLGSHKPNNLVMTLLSNTGIAGFLVFGIFLFELLRPRPATSFDVDVRRYRWMLVGLLSVHLISAPDLNPIILWISFAFVIGALTTQRSAVGDIAGDWKPRPLGAGG
jgi:hypothetical protein